VNNAFQDWVKERHGLEAWHRIASQVETGAFVGTEEYDDRTTLTLAEETGRELGLAADSVLEQVGEYFGRRSVGRDFGVLLNAGGATYGDFLRGLPDLQTRFALIYPNTEPPRFTLIDEGPDAATIVHHTARWGLAPLLAGVLAGIAAVFGTEAYVVRRPAQPEIGPGHVFRVRWNSAGRTSTHPAPSNRSRHTVAAA